VLPDRSMATIWKQTDQSSVYDREPVSLIPLYISSTQPVRRVMDSARLLARTNWIFFFCFPYPFLLFSVDVHFSTYSQPVYQRAREEWIL
jgi:hypothetical protein